MSWADRLLWELACLEHWRRVLRGPLAHYCTNPNVARSSFPLDATLEGPFDRCRCFERYGDRPSTPQPRVS